jgi:polyisoprenoid-binding protein YceI
MVGLGGNNTKGAPDMGDAPGTLEFRSHNKIYNAQGTFKRWRFTTIDIPDGDPERGTVEMEVDLASVWEKAAELVAHLLSSMFFDVRKYAKATVKVDRVKNTGDKTYNGLATLNLRGLTGEVPIVFEVVGEDPLEVEGKATVSRLAFGVGPPYDPDDEMAIVDDVEILLRAKLDSQS